MNRARTLSWVTLSGVFVLFALLYGRVVIQNDGISYYCLTISLLHDGDFDLTNQSQKYPEVRIVHNRKTGKVSSQYSSGFGILYAPFVFFFEQLSRFVPGLAQWKPYAQNARFPFPHSLGIFTGSIAFGFLTAILGIELLRRLYNASWMRAMILSVAVLAGGPLLFYVFTCPSFTQASDAMLVAVAFFLVVTPVSSIPRARIRNVLLGFVLALSVLLRNNNVVLVPILAGAQILLLKRQGIHRTLWSGIEVFLGALPVLLVHIWFNLDQYGGMVATGYGLKRSVTFLHRIQNLQSLFFHPIAGIFTNHPVTILAVVGWILGMRQRRPEAFVAAACAFTVILSLAYVGFIFPGSAFGQRILAHLYIFFLVGVYLFLQSFRVSGTILTILFVLWSFVSMNLYFVVTSQKEFRTNDRRGFDPFVMAVGAVQACRITGSSPAELWYESLTTGPYPTLHSILKKKAE